MKTQTFDPKNNGGGNGNDNGGNNGGGSQSGGDDSLIPTPDPNDIGQLNEGISRRKA